MANRRCFQSLSRYFQSIQTLTPLSQTLAAASAHTRHQTLNPKLNRHISGDNFSVHPHSVVFTRHFCSRHTDSENDDDDDDEDDEIDDSEGEEGEDRSENESVVLSAEDKVKEAAEIGYTVVGPLQKSDRVFKDYEPVFAVVQIGSHQFKVSNRDCIYTERLKHCDVNDKVVLNKVLMLGSQTQTIIGRPILPDAAVHAVVEEHALDAKVIIFKKKRRKNYRRTNGHRQELTKLRITDIQGIEKPEKITPPMKEKKEKQEKMAVEA
ncbi:50S ribosomal protein l21 mitochondrial [Phtheirospermum japonicum]|uniref:Large ribosomal subunit protein bL21m n=1 Tax=Phtheirospermum japonicum TaxID=374723 RepID=A0A830D787_9LAMI|nr:50S ribosomal protein l21 mitochondrial [Phtheirospermum japonicum]